MDPRGRHRSAPLDVLRVVWSGYGKQSWDGATNRITVLHDSFGSRPGPIKEWGFAALVEFEGRRILFDTGNDWGHRCHGWRG
jgi:hypothetical protein